MNKSKKGKCVSIFTNSGEKGGESGQWLGALAQASMEAKQPPWPKRKQPCHLLGLWKPATATPRFESADHSLAVHPLPQIQQKPNN